MESTSLSSLPKFIAPVMCRYLLVIIGVLAAPVVTGAEDADVGDVSSPNRGDFTMRGYDARIQDGIDLIYRLEFSAADAYFDVIVARHPDNPLGYFFRAMVTWWRVLVDLEDTSHDEALYRLLKDCIEVCDRRLEENPDDFDAILFKAGSIGFRGRLRGDRDQFLRAASDGLKCLPLLKRSRALEPTNKDILFGQGIYNYFAEVIPKKYPIVRPAMLFLKAGDREKGLQQLQEVADEGRYAKAEAAYFLAQIYRIFENDKARALDHLNRLYERYPQNALFHRYRARTLAELGRWDRAIPSYREVVDKSEEGAAGYHIRGRIEAQYYLGKYAFVKNRLEEARGHLALADSLSLSLGDRPEEQAVRGYVSLANLYLGMACDQLGRRSDALRRYERVRALPKHGASHKLADKYARTSYTTLLTTPDPPRSSP
jgi:tetratricopeptide (TPR) repeat protein